MPEPTIIAQRENFRLVHRIRDQNKSTNYSDLTLERLIENAMEEPIWVTVDSWMLCPQPHHEILHQGESSAIVALNLILTKFNIIAKPS